MAHERWLGNGPFDDGSLGAPYSSRYGRGRLTCLQGTERAEEAVWATGSVGANFIPPPCLSGALSAWEWANTRVSLLKGKRAPGRWLPWGWGLFVPANWGAALDQRRVYYLLLADAGRAGLGWPVEPSSSRCRLSVGLADGDGRRWIGRFAGAECIQC